MESAAATTQAVQPARDPHSPLAVSESVLTPTLALDPASILALQRTAGNRSVTTLLRNTRAILARDKLPALSSTELMNFMLSQRGFSGSKPGMPAVDPK